MTAAGAHDRIAGLERTCAGCGEPIRPGEPATVARRAGHFPLRLDVELPPPQRTPAWHCRCLAGDGEEGGTSG